MYPRFSGRVIGSPMNPGVSKGIILFSTRLDTGLPPLRRRRFECGTAMVGSSAYWKHPLSRGADSDLHVVSMGVGWLPIRLTTRSSSGILRSLLNAWLKLSRDSHSRLTDTISPALRRLSARSQTNEPQYHYTPPCLTTRQNIHHNSPPATCPPSSVRSMTLPAFRHRRLPVQWR